MLFEIHNAFARCEQSTASDAEALHAEIANEQPALAPHWLGLVAWQASGDASLLAEEFDTRLCALACGQLSWVLVQLIPLIFFEQKSRAAPISSIGRLVYWEKEAIALLP